MLAISLSCNVLSFVTVSIMVSFTMATFCFTSSKPLRLVIAVVAVASCIGFLGAVFAYVVYVCSVNINKTVNTESSVQHFNMSI